MSNWDEADNLAAAVVRAVAPGVDTDACWDASGCCSCWVPNLAVITVRVGRRTLDVQVEVEGIETSHRDTAPEALRQAADHCDAMAKRLRTGADLLEKR